MRLFWKVLTYVLPALGSVGAESLPWPVREWRSQDGKEIRARLVKQQGSEITLRLQSGKDVATSVNFLSETDQQYLAGEKARIGKMLKKEVSDKLAALSTKGAAAVKKANKPVASLSSIAASQVYRMGIPVPSPGGGTIAKVRGKVVQISSFRESSLETIIVELEGGLCLSAGSHEAVWGGSKQKLRIENRTLIKYPQPKEAKSSKNAKTVSPAQMAPIRLFGVGDQVTLTGRLHFADDKAGSMTGFFARGYDLLAGPAPKQPATRKRGRNEPLSAAHLESRQAIRSASIVEQNLMPPVPECFLLLLPLRQGFAPRAARIEQRALPRRPKQQIDRDGVADKFIDFRAPGEMFS